METLENAVRLLDNATRQYLKFCKTYKNAETMMFQNGNMPEETLKYLIGKLRQNKKDFAGFYNNLDYQNQKYILQSLRVIYDYNSKDPNFNKQEDFSIYLQKMNKIKQNNDYVAFWQMFTFETKFLSKFLILAFNNNPQEYLTQLEPNLWEHYRRSKIKNFGSALYWGKFWQYLAKNNIPGRKEIAKDVLTDPFKF